MKVTKIILTVVAVFTLIAVISCGSSPAPSSGGKARGASNDLFNQLDPVIEKTYMKLSERLTPRLRIALLPPGSTDMGARAYVFDELYIMFIDSQLYSMVDRADIDKALAEQNFQASGLVDDNTAVEFAKLLGAQVVAFGDLPEIGSARQRLVYRALEVQTGRMLVISSERF